MSESTQVAIRSLAPIAEATAFSSIQAFESAQRMAQALAASSLVPKAYQGNVADCIVALELAQRIGASPLMVAQNLNIINGRPSWASQFIIASLNSCGRFSPLRFKMDGTGDAWSCVASAIDKSGEVLEGPKVTIAMAKAEGWYQKSGSKWQTMPDLMLRYRAAAFFGRLYAPDVLMGMSSMEESHDIIDVTPSVVSSQPTEAAAAVNEKIRQRRQSKKDAEPVVQASAAEPAVQPSGDHF